jgi:hypothetical protein
MSRKPEASGGRAMRSALAAVLPDVLSAYAFSLMRFRLRAAA